MQKERKKSILLKKLRDPLDKSRITISQSPKLCLHNTYFSNRPVKLKKKAANANISEAGTRKFFICLLKGLVAHSHAANLHISFTLTRRSQNTTVLWPRRHFASFSAVSTYAQRHHLLKNCATKLQSFSFTRQTRAGMLATCSL